MLTATPDDLWHDGAMEDNVILASGSRTFDAGPVHFWAQAARTNRQLKALTANGELRFGQLPELVTALSDLAEDGGADDRLLGRRAAKFLAGCSQTVKVTVSPS